MRRRLAAGLVLCLAAAGCAGVPERDDEAPSTNPLAALAAALDARIDHPGIEVAAEPGRLVLVLPEASILLRGEPVWLLEEGEDTLEVVAAALRGLSGEVQVIGHTDNTGTPAYAQDLSERQAQAVAEALEAGGVAPRRLRSFGLGDQEPVVANDSPRNRGRNRRVVVVAASGR